MLLIHLKSNYILLNLKLFKAFLKPIFKIAFLIHLLLVFSCQKLDLKRINKVVTDEIVISPHEVLLMGKVIDLSEHDIESYGHLWGADSLNFNKTILGKEIKQVYFESKISGLQFNKTYYYKSYIKNTNGEITYGEINSFNLNSKNYSVGINTSSFDIKTPSTLSVSGKINGLGALSIQQYGHCWGQTLEPNLLDNHSNLGFCIKDTSFKTEIINLNTETNYNIRAYAKLDENTIIYGNTVSVKIPDLKVSSGNYAINAGIASLKGTIESLSISPVTDHGHCWTTVNSQPTVNNNKISLGSSSQIGDFYNNLTLVSGLTYYYRAYAITGNSIKYGLIKKIVY